MSSKVAVVIPIYKEEINDLEKISLAQVRKVLRNYPIIFVAPEGKNFSYLETGEMLIQFHPQYFQSVETYSRLLLSPFFYETFSDFDYILLYQLDAFVFYDALEEFCRLGYDYIGAAFPVSWGNVNGKKNPRVGNGGFSLRKVKACRKLLTENYSLINNVSEDSFFTLCGTTTEIDFQTAPVEVANLFSMEHYPDRCIKRLGYELPFGCHGWTRLSADFYIELFARLGYDLYPLRDQMQTKDYEFYLPRSLEIIAVQRLIRGLKYGQSVLKYLPLKRFAAVRVIRTPDAMKILARLLTEENSLADEIFIYDKANIQALIHDAEQGSFPQLLICADYEIAGKNIVSFRQEYLKAQEKLFHSLGK
ncbi:MAG: hypothetical protein IKZ53_06705 [Selenomonadaceae bacterium]|nr:hypothetical protein [Selenomonadaceae bacterium]